MSMQYLPMLLVSASVTCFAIGYFKKPVCNVTGSYEDTCTTVTNYSNNMAAFSASGALIMFSLMSMGMMAMPRGGMSYGMF